MATLAAVLSSATGVEIDVDSLRSALTFCGAGLAFSILLIAHGYDLGVASDEGTRLSQTRCDEASRHTRDKLPCYPVRSELGEAPMADDEIEILMKARAALAKTRFSWAQKITTPGEVPQTVVSAIVEVQRAIDVIDRAIEELEEADELEAEEEE
jgi:hypothetical protein